MENFQHTISAMYFHYVPMFMHKASCLLAFGWQAACQVRMIDFLLTIFQILYMKIFL